MLTIRALLISKRRRGTANADLLSALDPTLAARVMLAVGLSMLITPMPARLGRTIGERGERAAQLNDPGLREAGRTIPEAANPAGESNAAL